MFICELLNLCTHSTFVLLKMFSLETTHNSSIVQTTRKTWGYLCRRMCTAQGYWPGKSSLWEVLPLGSIGAVHHRQTAFNQALSFSSKRGGWGIIQLVSLARSSLDLQSENFNLWWREQRRRSYRPFCGDPSLRLFSGGTQRMRSRHAGAFYQALICCIRSGDFPY